MNFSSRRLSAVVIALAAVFTVPLAFAQSYPNKPIRLIVPYPPGGGTDIVARLIANKLTQSMGQSVLVDNKPGASTIIGTDMVAKSPADGYTVGLITYLHAINPSFFPKLPYDTFKDFDFVTQLVFVPLVLVANPSLNVKTVSDLIAAAKANPGKINYASIGNGTPHHLAMEWFKALSGTNLTHIPYKGVAPATADVVGGQVDVMFTGTSTAVPYVSTGKLIALGVSSGKRQPSLPAVPSVGETLPEFDFMTWYGIAVPAGTPKDITARLSREIGAALKQPDVIERMTALGLVGNPSTPEEFTAFVKASSESLSKLVKVTGVKGE